MDQIEVMHFRFKLKDGAALVGSGQKWKPGSEEPLKKKFGEKEYDAAKDAFDDALKSWKSNEEALNESFWNLRGIQTRC